MDTFEHEVQRLESQVGELIRILANINKRLGIIEETNEKRLYLRQIPLERKTKVKDLRV